MFDLQTGITVVTVIANPIASTLITDFSFTLMVHLTFKCKDFNNERSPYNKLSTLNLKTSRRSRLYEIRLCRIHQI